MSAIHIDRKQVPAHLIGAYAGKHFKFEVAAEVTIPSDAGLWSGGTRDVYFALRLADGARLDAYPHHLAPWDGRTERKVTLSPGFALVRHSHFCGKDFGLHFYVHAADTAALLPAPIDHALTAHEKIVLSAVSRFKSSYGGRDRYAMALDDARPRFAIARQQSSDGFPSRAEWETAKATLIGKGLLNKAGALTTAGKNVKC